MDALSFDNRPSLRSPILLLAFAGWSDAGASATTAVRYLADEFIAQYRRERALLEELRPFLPGGVADALLRDGERIEQLQQKLDRIGRRRRTARTVSVTAELLLSALRAWCADIESAASEIDRLELPEEAQRALASFKLYTQVHR